MFAKFTCVASFIITLVACDTASTPVPDLAESLRGELAIGQIVVDRGNLNAVTQVHTDAGLVLISLHLNAAHVDPAILDALTAQGHGRVELGVDAATEWLMQGQEALDTAELSERLHGPLGTICGTAVARAQLAVDLEGNSHPVPAFVTINQPVPDLSGVAFELVVDNECVEQWQGFFTWVCENLSSDGGCDTTVMCPKEIVEETQVCTTIGGTVGGTGSGSGTYECRTVRTTKVIQVPHVVAGTCTDAPGLIFNWCACEYDAVDVCN